MAALEIKVVVITAFEADAGSVPGEFRLWREREQLDREMPFAQGYRPLHLNGRGVLGVVTGVGAVRAAASVMALGLDPRFDLTRAYFLITGVAGVDPSRGSLASVVLPEYVVDGNFAHEIDAREIPSSWPDGFVPIGRCEPYEQPRAERFNADDGINFHLNPELVAWAFTLAQATELLDTADVAQRRVQFEPANTAHQPPSALRGDELSSTTFWHGKLMSQRARAWVRYQTEGRGVYAITGMEDAGILQALTFLASAGRVSLDRVLIVRGASNYDQQREGIGAAESLAETKVASYSAYLPALENVHRVGHCILKLLLEVWPGMPR